MIPNVVRNSPAHFFFIKSILFVFQGGYKMMTKLLSTSLSGSMKLPLVVRALVFQPIGPGSNPGGLIQSLAVAYIHDLVLVDVWHFHLLLFKIPPEMYLCKLHLLTCLT